MATVLAVALRRLALLAVATLPAGCLTLPAGMGGHRAKPERASQMTAVWQNTVVQAPDTLRGGQPYNCLAGKVYLFSAEGSHPLQADGRFVVELFDESAEKPVLMHRWDNPPEVVRQLGKKDVVGWCYTLPLPLPEGMQVPPKVRLRTGYLPVDGPPVYSDNALTLEPGNGVIRSGGPPLTPTRASVTR